MAWHEQRRAARGHRLARRCRSWTTTRDAVGRRDVQAVAARICCRIAQVNLVSTRARDPPSTVRARLGAAGRRSAPRTGDSITARPSTSTSPSRSNGTDGRARAALRSWPSDDARAGVTTTASTNGHPRQVVGQRGPGASAPGVRPARRPGQVVPAGDEDEHPGRAGDEARRALGGDRVHGGELGQEAVYLLDRFGRHCSRPWSAVHTRGLLSAGRAWVLRPNVGRMAQGRIRPAHRR